MPGYAIFPGSRGRRDLFNWWLLEVVPSTWCLQFPESIYTIKGVIPFNFQSTFSGNMCRRYGGDPKNIYW